MTNVFRAVRALSNIDEADYMLSLAGDFNYIEFIANSKSGQFFFYSHDGKYMIKTQSKEESKLLRRIMPGYMQHLSKHPDSLLVRFYGMHRVKMKSLRSKTYFVIMSSVFNTSKSIAVKYDLKGSTVGRLTSPEDCRAGAVQKDINLMESGEKREKRETILVFSNSFSNCFSFFSFLFLSNPTINRKQNSIGS
jgi:1-phosphatidylinositol-4-phosphate 5-kinase